MAAEKHKSIQSMNSMEKHLPELAAIDRRLLEQLYNKYRLDFEAFGYHFDFDTHMATCAIDVGNGDVCC